MRHVFVSPHPDDVALSCGGLIAGLRDRGEEVTIVTVHGGCGPATKLTTYQVTTLGFADRRPVPTADEAMGFRRAEDDAFGRIVGARIVQVLRPDAIFRGYFDPIARAGGPDADDAPPVEELRKALAQVAPDHLYLPLAIGDHVDHTQTRRAGIALLAEPGSPYVDRTAFFEDFPYSFRVGWEGIGQLSPDALASLPGRLQPEYFEVEPWLERKLDALRAAYPSQLAMLFDSDAAMVEQFRTQAARTAAAGGCGPAERYWRLVAR